jgi:sugar phosphate isomerase/epimerase
MRRSKGESSQRSSARSEPGAGGFTTPRADYDFSVLGAATREEGPALEGAAERWLRAAHRCHRFCKSGSAGDRIEPPHPGHALELASPAVFETEA